MDQHVFDPLKTEPLEEKKTGALAEAQEKQESEQEIIYPASQPWIKQGRKMGLPAT